MSQEEHFLSKECQEFNYCVACMGDFHLTELSPDSYYEGPLCKAVAVGPAVAGAGRSLGPRPRAGAVGML